jgi:hypothetical protein
MYLLSRHINCKFFPSLPEEFQYCKKHLIHQRNSQRRNFLRRVFPGYISFYVPIKSRLFTIPDNTVLSNSIGIPNVSLSSFLPRSKKQQSFVHKSLEGEDIPGDFGPPSLALQQIRSWNSSTGGQIQHFLYTLFSQGDCEGNGKGKFPTAPLLYP